MSNNRPGSFAGNGPHDVRAFPAAGNCPFAAGGLQPPALGFDRRAGIGARDRRPEAVNPPATGDRRGKPLLTEHAFHETAAAVSRSARRAAPSFAGGKVGARRIGFSASRPLQTAMHWSTTCLHRESSFNMRSRQCRALSSPYSAARRSTLAVRELRVVVETSTFATRSRVGP